MEVKPPFGKNDIIFGDGTTASKKIFNPLIHSLINERMSGIFQESFFLEVLEKWREQQTTKNYRHIRRSDGYYAKYFLMTDEEILCLIRKKVGHILRARRQGDDRDPKDNELLALCKHSEFPVCEELLELSSVAELGPVDVFLSATNDEALKLQGNQYLLTLINDAVDKYLIGDISQHVTLKEAAKIFLERYSSKIRFFVKKDDGKLSCVAKTKHVVNWLDQRFALCLKTRLNQVKFSKMLECDELGPLDVLIWKRNDSEELKNFIAELEGNKHLDDLIENKIKTYPASDAPKS